MTVRQMINEMQLTPLTCPDPERVVTGGYVGDLLSWVMGRARSGQAWITIMSNINTVAVASLADVACVILAEGCAACRRGTGDLLSHHVPDRL